MSQETNQGIIFFFNSNAYLLNWPFTQKSFQFTNFQAKGHFFQKKMRLHRKLLYYLLYLKRFVKTWLFTFLQADKFVNILNSAPNTMPSTKCLNRYLLEHKCWRFSYDHIPANDQPPHFMCNRCTFVVFFVNVTNVINKNLSRSQ